MFSCFIQTEKGIPGLKRPVYSLTTFQNSIKPDKSQQTHRLTYKETNSNQLKPSMRPMAANSRKSICYDCQKTSDFIQAKYFQFQQKEVPTPQIEVSMKQLILATKNKHLMDRAILSACLEARSFTLGLTLFSVRTLQTYKWNKTKHT